MTPCAIASGTTLSPKLFFKRGNVTSMLVAPATLMALKEIGESVAKRGINIKERVSLSRLLKNETAPKWGSPKELIITPEREYHPKPETNANACLIE